MFRVRRFAAESDIEMTSHPYMPKRTACSRGFTLVELISTILIIALIAAVSGPRFFDINVFQQQGFYDETISAIRYAQKYAVATGCAVQVTVAGNSYTLTQIPLAAFVSNNPATCNTPPYTGGFSDPSNAGNNFARAAPAGMTLNSVPAAFVFCPLGDTSAGACTGTYANVDVTLSVNAQPITVWGATGFVQR
jgi:MSHA pilin protein MshC